MISAKIVCIESRFEGRRALVWEFFQPRIDVLKRILSLAMHMSTDVVLGERNMSYCSMSGM